MLMVFMWYFRTRGGGRDLSTAGWLFENKLHSIIRMQLILKRPNSSTQISSPTSGSDVHTLHMLNCIIRYVEQCPLCLKL